MMASGKANFMLLIYFVIVMSILVFIPMSGNVGPYSFPPSILALNVIKYGEISLPSQSPVRASWTGSLYTERDYPVPALTLAALQLISNIPCYLLPFLPISEFIVFIFYYLVLLKLLLKKKTLIDLYKTMYYLTTFMIIIYDLFNRIHAYYVGRATLGVAFLVMAIFLIMRLITSNNRSAWIILLMVLLTAISFTYYTSVLAISFALLLLLFTSTVKPSLFNQYTKGSILSLAIFSLLLVLHQPIVNALMLSPNNLINNFVEWFLTQLRIERETEAYNLIVGEVPLDIFTRISVVWLGNVIRVLFILMFIFYLLSELLRERGLNVKEPANTLAIIAIGLFLAELFYTFQAPTVSLRFITMTSVFYVPLIITRMKKARTKKVLSFVILILLAIFYIGTLNRTLSYGRVNDLQNLYGFDSFISSIAQHNLRSVIIAGDSYYTSYAYFRAAANNAGAYLHFVILRNYVFYLFKLYDDYSIIKQYIRELTTKYGIDYLMLVNDGKPITGDPWGYTVMPSYTSINLLIRHLDVTYNDGQVYLLHLAPT